MEVYYGKCKRPVAALRTTQQVVDRGNQPELKVRLCTECQSLYLTVINSFLRGNLG